MLERQELWLGPWSADDPRRRAISEAPGLEPLGQARWRPRPTSLWERWWTRPTLEVVETEDESLLLTVRRFWGWGPAWDVYDADEHCLGTVTGRTVRDSLERRLAFVEQSVDASAWRILSPDGPELATADVSADGCLLTFSAPIDDNPFAKMLVLAVLLVPDN